MQRTPVFGDPKTDFVFQCVFTWRSEDHKTALLGFLNDILQARALLTVLRGRGIAVPDAARERILAEKDPARLEHWLEKAGTSATVAELFDDPS